MSDKKPSVQAARAAEGMAEPRQRWRHLDARADSWRKQLSLKGRGLTVGQLVSTIRANKLTNEQASANLGLPREAIEEALAFYEENRALIEEEAEAERRWLTERGYPLEPHNIS
jgi:uncharacterized protein (DUF433 family)